MRESFHRRTEKDSDYKQSNINAAKNQNYSSSNQAIGFHGKAKKRFGANSKEIPTYRWSKVSDFMHRFVSEECKRV